VWRFSTAPEGVIDDRIKPFALDRFDRECPVHDPAVVLASH
jgi:hypothetical protein